MNTTIHVLDNETIDRIAAGEVVERPLSVVKELVENAIDAGSTAITVDIENGGIEFIRVTDNGSGIAKSELDKAFMRHATSKIESADDLSSIASLGFRGEALSSIASVARVELITKTSDELVGCRYCIEGGEFKSLSDIGAPNGTTFLVRNLFYNTPVRRKFLKSEITEGNYIAELMERFALANPKVSIQFMMNHKLRFQTSGNGDLKEIIYRIFGKDVTSSMKEIDATCENLRIHGYLGKPILVRSNRNYEITFVNSRYVKSNLVFKSIEDGYAGYLMQHKFPFCVLEIDIDVEKVDVNVHPNKMDVRFSEQKAVHDDIMNAIHDCLSKQEMISHVNLNTAREENARIREEIKQLKAEVPKTAPQPFEQKRIEHIESAPSKLVNSESSHNVSGMPQKPKSISFWNDEEDEPETIEKIEKIEKTGTNTQEVQEPAVTNEIVQLSLFREQSFETKEKLTGNTNEDYILDVDFESQYTIIGQFFKTYWLVEYKDDILMIDQHAAHEKVKYEELVEHMEKSEVISESLNPPIVVRLSAREIGVLNEYEELMQTLGFISECFGGNDYAIRTVPMDLYGFNAKDMFLEILDELDEHPVKQAPEAILHRMATMACKAAVKGNMEISESEARELIHKLMKLKNPYHCPHGRPVIVAMSKAEVERKFKRIVN